MTIQGYEFQSEFARKFYGKGRREGHKEGHEKGHKEGHEKGHKEGLAYGEAKAVLTVLQARGLEVSDEQRGFIISCKDLALLDRWLVLCATVSSTEALLRSSDE